MRVLWNLALVLEQQGERIWAEQLYGKIPEDSPEWCDATFRLGYLRLLRAEFAYRVHHQAAVAGLLWMRPKRLGHPTEEIDDRRNAGIGLPHAGQA